MGGCGDSHGGIRGSGGPIRRRHNKNHGRSPDVPSRATEHPHKIHRKLIRDIFTCKLCDELGTQWRYCCRIPECNLNIHPACGEALIVTIRPLVYGGRHQFDFRRDPVDDNRYCVACGKRIRRFNYHCELENLDLHPDCTRNFPSPHITEGNLRPKLDEQLNNGTCRLCDRSTYGGGNLNTWAYVSNCGTYQSHAGCVLDSGIEKHRRAFNIPITRSKAHQNRRGPPQTTNGFEGYVQLFNAITQAVNALFGLPSN